MYATLEHDLNHKKSHIGKQSHSQNRLKSSITTYVIIHCSAVKSTIQSPVASVAKNRFEKFFDGFDL